MYRNPTRPDAWETFVMKLVPKTQIFSFLSSLESANGCTFVFYRFSNFVGLIFVVLSLSGCSTLQVSEAGPGLVDIHRSSYARVC